ncbi:Epsin-3, clathrin recruitment and traffic between the Golgi and endosome [Dimargaris xerosporica]|nr:Epsin-3, clathrin recruitment and traffic between the Golgi and endosome [Dimargaris xerosporica]
MDSISLWDVKDMITKVKNAVMNYTEMEIKVNEATNSDPWGASSTLMKEIAAGTHNFQQFNEIMPFIYKRFSDSEAHQWREIYKATLHSVIIAKQIAEVIAAFCITGWIIEQALTLLEYLAKNGSERVIDDAKGHITLIKMLRSFHYIDDQGKDQGINVRQRSKELVDLLQNSTKLREERKKAKANRNKYTGVSSAAGGFGSCSGFGNITNSSAYHDFANESETSSPYNQYDTETQSTGSSRPTHHAAGSSRLHRNDAPSTPQPPSPPAAEPAPNLLDFDDNFDAPTPPAAATATDSAAVDDDWGDFQSTTPVAPPNRSAAPLQPTMTTASLQPALAAHSTMTSSANALAADLDLLGVNDAAAPAIAPMDHRFPFTSPPMSTSSSGIGATATTTLTSPPSAPASAPAKKGDIWSQNSSLVSLDLLGSSGSGNKSNQAKAAKPTMSSLANMQAINKLGGGSSTGRSSGMPPPLVANAMTAPAYTAAPTSSGGSGQSSIKPLSKNDLDMFL